MGVLMGEPNEFKQLVGDLSIGGPIRWGTNESGTPMRWRTNEIGGEWVLIRGQISDGLMTWGD